MAKLILDPEKCQGHGRCTLICPELFSTDPNGFAFVASSTVPDDLHWAAQHAIRSCPERAIELIDE
jgi:ferredoxin